MRRASGDGENRPAEADRLAETGELEKYGYHPAMESIHIRNRIRLGEIIREYGLPTVRNAGEKAAAAAWRIVQHSIGDPAFMRGCLKLYGNYTCEDIPLWMRAYLEDRIAFYERRPQRYGTQFDFGADGRLCVWLLEDRAAAERLRAEAGMCSLEEAERHFASCSALTPQEAARKRKEQEDWLIRTGWCTAEDIKKCNICEPADRAE